MTGVRCTPLRSRSLAALSRLRAAAGHLAALMVLCLGGSIPSGPAAAHHRASGPHSGLPIPSLTHGQMQVVAAHRGEILDLADRQVITDQIFRRLRNFAELQHAACLWNIMPGAVTDEASPFNECAHADLAAVAALLAHMRMMPDAAPAARSMQAAIDRDANVGAAPLCRFSDEPFNTADVIGPDWSGVPGHTPTLLALLATGGMLTSAGAGVWAGTRRHGAA